MPSAQELWQPIDLPKLYEFEDVAILVRILAWALSRISAWPLTWAKFTFDHKCLRSALVVPIHHGRNGEQFPVRRWRGSGVVHHVEMGFSAIGPPSSIGKGVNWRAVPSPVAFGSLVWLAYHFVN